ncbi:NAD(P)/FAD-dependent oxidoreductase [Runella sp. MFBS21]|uniref:flavin monoamine oxidase family protein n=1 Tax=Runella sp. MFBS21 TaxID=3034018 RepID=UPI0023F7026D|nr:NAD(P)/FAD-dependent oxidoreductase [Runella sp. MFBS21]MDF7819535.1 NAD(P)/FAD-dependent oxidoreductase [Runella sp. MFBS21]
MQRRDFIKNTLITTGAVALGSCQDKIPDANRKYEGQIAIIGAGAAGLYAGQLLEEQEAKYTIYEASDQIGGRIRSLKGLADFDLELGAEEIYGSPSQWYDWVKAAGATLIKSDSANDFYQIGSQIQNEEQLKTNTNFQAAISLVRQALSYTGDDMTLLQFLNARSVPSDVRYVVESILANKYGTSAGRLSVKSMAEQSNIWSAGTDLYTSTNLSLTNVLTEKFKNILPKVILNMPIRRIDYSNERIMLEDSQAQRRFVDKVIITVPLSILQSGDLQLTPALPETHTNALKNIGMGAGMKVTLIFNKRFWDANASMIYTAGVVPQFKVNSYGREGKSFVLTATIMGEKAEFLSTQSATVLVQAILKDLDTLYGKGAATTALTNVRITDWTKEPYIKGAFSYPLVGGGGLLTRQVLSQPVKRRIYFAGEATHYGGHSGTVHGAIESSRRAVDELLRDVS